MIVIAIEKMSFARITGPVAGLDRTLAHILCSGMFQPEQAAKYSEYSIGSPLDRQNPFEPLLARARELSDRLGGVSDIRRPHAEEKTVPDGGQLLRFAQERLDELAQGYDALAAERKERDGRVAELNAALFPGSERKGLPGDAVAAPDDTNRAVSPEALEKALAEEGREAERLELMLANSRGELAGLIRELTLCREAAALRGYAVELHGQFYVIGYLLTRNESAFKGLLAEAAVFGVTVSLSPATCDLSGLPPPVRLRNGRFSRPFEMFVEMYGTPGYGDIDPTPFVAWTYSLLFGIMFGDLGQGLVISLLGFLLGRFRGMSLGPVMTRIGFFSAAFGLLY
ncbi:MAG: hypothetical protein LBU86_07170, partial [Oscillospiraceae bacterium]|nr:hypothetical protein [Oscillospiraceae bacterium]